MAFGLIGENAGDLRLREKGWVEVSGDGVVPVVSLAEEKGRGSLEKGSVKEQMVVMTMILQRC